MIPQDTKFTKSHEWVKLDGAATTIGISHYAVEQLGDVVFIELPTIGDTVTAQSPMGTIESVKAAVELYAPINGEVVDVNEAIMGDFDLLSNEPYENGWLVKINPTNPADMDALMSVEQYETYLQSDESQH